MITEIQHDILVKIKKLVDQLPDSNGVYIDLDQGIGKGHIGEVWLIQSHREIECLGKGHVCFEESKG